MNDMVEICTKTIQNILSNFIPHQTITIDDKGPPWFTTKAESLLQKKNEIYKNIRKDRNNTQNGNIYRTSLTIQLIPLNITTILEKSTN